jgi:putative acetyltransferase
MDCRANMGRRLAEMKRMYVRPIYRGRGVGKSLALAILHEADDLGYQRIVLDTAPSMIEAIGLYEGLGFQRIEPYRHYPVDDVIFMELVFKPLRGDSS